MAFTFALLPAGVQEAIAEWLGIHTIGPHRAVSSTFVCPRADRRNRTFLVFNRWLAVDWNFIRNSYARLYGAPAESELRCQVCFWQQPSLAYLNTENIHVVRINTFLDAPAVVCCCRREELRDSPCSCRRKVAR